MKASRTVLICVLGAVGVILIGWGAGELVKADTGGFDLRAVIDLARDRTPALTTISRALSVVGSAWVVLPMALVGAVALHRLGHPRAAALLLLGAVGATAIANVDKVLVDRPRPPVHHLQAVTSSSFPSGHASQATGFYLSALIVMLWIGGRALRWAAAVVVAVVILGVAFSRVYLGVHYPTDVAAGILLAGGWTVLVARAVGWPG